MKYAYFPDVTESPARDQYESTMAVARAPGIDMVEPSAGPAGPLAHQVDHDLATALAPPTREGAKTGLDMV
jgi:hypothetical protein